ncbi:MAG: nucleotide sugar dehydrogenase [Candidatus Omnitrophica bacterium CG07_land_8_20_14_0_80_42_15]|uniref:Nucleotide sugar dehydrogenase n=1 Tax=Candidatus Aquitaenariimonas noxiae TaxID=1974741 RepID=A0A2J0KRJ3_9BACT|nr:MAG: nucleotide sugar dehydrogenase [Candidatus Omnitrophica bacterium CG07_land_8_20_14_0_80_42_15]
MNIYKELTSKRTSIAVVGLGYVGMPLAIEFGKVVKTIGFDLNSKRIAELKKGIDRNGETKTEEIKEAKLIEFTDKPEKLKEAKFIIVAVPTPINKNKQPDLYCMTSASEVVGKNLTKGSIVVYESTVYPGVTEDICIPILEKCSKLKYGKDFKAGYSPERINPGDKEHNVRDIIKVVSGCDKETLEEVANIYSIVVKAGVFRAASIKTAEAAKVIENTQRDLNIALMNELSIIFNRMGIDTLSVLEAAGTKWNFVKMKPGLVGGHCIGVDPYYLTFKAEELGYNPQVILAGRRINDNMGKYIAEQTVKKLIEAGKAVKGSKVMVAGITFKENVSDIRNSRVIDIINELKEYGIDTIVFDPLADKEEVKHEYGIELVEYNKKIKADGLILAVCHDAFKKLLVVDMLEKHLVHNGAKGVVVDVKGMMSVASFKGSNVLYWRL